MADITIWGVVNANGTTKSGTGFKVDHVGTGIYTILFDKSFNVLPAVVTTQLFPGNDPDSHGGDPRDNTVVAYIGNDRCRVITGQDNGDKEDRAFSFVAIGQ
ncbi:MAG: hypothetical protein JO345_37035 [Streptosporangiaceae bacterium]|nr:hypothetical protein [Streptosporangiaceae bacterium]